MDRPTLLLILVKIVLVIAIIAFLAWKELWGSVTLFMGLALWSLALALARNVGIDV